MADQAPEMMKSTLVAGGIAGLVAGIPGFDLVNQCTCCSFVMVGGFLASYLYSRECRAANYRFRPGNGAMIGLVAGAFYALSTTIVQSLALAAVGPLSTRWFVNFASELVEKVPDFPAELADQLETTREAAEQATFSFGQMIGSLLVAILVGAAFSTIGGLIGGAVFKYEPRPVPPPVAEDGPVSE